MAKFQRNPKNPWVLVILLLLGGLAGSAVGQLFAPTWRFLGPVLRTGLGLAELDLHFLKLTFGFSVNIGVLTLLGFILGYLLYRRI
ncbi:MAG: Uncharacterized protein XD69_0083 [Clostridia bacterium 62_21]|nr:MAG: Uncharacterized protein XD69_0083 [Clostridia bacterium 62_21]HAG07491.1 DUF4321 domain-containing protein [Peptococcaceae bacterium]